MVLKTDDTTAFEIADAGAPFEKAVDSKVRVRDLALGAGMNGTPYWTYDSFEQDRLHHATTNWPLFVQKMGNFENDSK